MTDEYEIPKTWPPKDVIEWINATLDEPGVKSVEVVRHKGGWACLVHRDT